MGADDGRDASVKIPAKGDFFAGGFAVEIKENDFSSRFPGDLGEEFVGFAKWVVARRHEDATLEVNDSVGLSGWEFALIEPKAGSSHCVVGGAKDTTAALVRICRDSHVFKDLFFVPDMITGGDDMGAKIKELFGNGRCKAEAARCIFSVDDEEIDGVGFKDVGKVFADDVAAGGAKDVADKKDVH